MMRAFTAEQSITELGLYWGPRLRGIMLVALMAFFAMFVADRVGAPPMLIALLLGMSFHFLADNQNCAAGVEMSAKPLLQLGVGLLGTGLSFASLSQVESGALLAIPVLVLATLGGGVLIASLLGQRLAFGLLGGGAVAICGASAALAIAAVLPRGKGQEQNTAFVVVGVTALSTIAMVTYPTLFALLGFNDVQSGFLIGATIHDVAQVVAAGYSVSDEAGIVATVVKLVRVSMLPIVVLTTAYFFNKENGGKFPVPWFLFLFAACGASSAYGVIPEYVADALFTVAKGLLVLAVAAIGIRTNIGRVLKLDRVYHLVLILTTLWLATIAVAGVSFLGLIA